MSRRPRRPARAPAQRGASTYVVAGVSAVLLVVGYTGIGITSIAVSEERAQSLADAAAHAAVGELMADPAHDDAAALVQADAGACWWEASWLSAPGGAHLDAKCAAAETAAQAAVKASPTARLVALVIAPEARDDGAGSPAPTRLSALATVAVPRNLSLPAVRCDDNPGLQPDLCFALAQSSAEET